MGTKTQKRHIAEDSIESKRGDFSQVDQLKETPKKLLESVWKDFFEASVKQDAPSQIFGLEGGRRGSKKDLEESVEYDIASEGEFVLKKEAKGKGKEETTEIIQTAEHREYFRQMESNEVSRGEQRIIEERVKEILGELKMLSKSSKTMEVIFKQVSTEEMPVNPGTYHINFFEWLLLVLQSARKKIDEGASWLAMFASKKKQKQYWNMNKKHGTTFSLSSERTVATQTA